MQKLKIRFSIISLFFLVFSSCAVKTLEGFDKKETALEVFKSPYFSDKNEDYVYKASISVYGNNFGGIFIAKKISETVHRAVFTTEFGNTLFDFEISENDFKVNHIIEELDRKILINTLKRDFMLLLKENFKVSEQFENESFKVYKSPDGKRFNYLFENKSDGKFSKLVHATKSNEKINIEYLSENNTLADKIVIQHQNIKLRIELNKIIN